MKRFKIAKFVGVFGRDSEVRRNQGRPDRCFDICYRDRSGKLVWEKIGWASEGYTAAMAGQIRSERLRAIRHGEELPREKETPKQATFGEAWTKVYEWAQTNHSSHKDDLSRYNMHLKADLYALSLAEVSPFLLERIKGKMKKAGSSPQTIKHTLGLVRIVFNKSKEWGDFQGDNPVSKVKLPSTVHTNRQRFLTREEAQQLLDECSKYSLKLHDIVLLSLQTGMRAGEIFNLRWGDVLPSQGILHILDSKNGKSRQALLTEDLKKMFARKDKGAAKEFVFVSQRGTKTKSVSGSYDKAVATLGFNDGVEDRRQRVVFHTLRHTFGSWLAMSGAHPRVIMDLMGHSRLEQTMRYTHLAPDQKRQAVDELERMLSSPGASEKSNGARSS